ncbi:ABC transporter substrate-binding protein [Arthrobacter sp. BL-252-APC-1A]|jgi:putative ABC transport system substrate-binding protein|uniref:ABC transporter substrate-binding protein n=1 Tax=Arthrobacter sp. BL-252-APC-1A TaxID=2606622 RepID=UPI0012B3ECA2|nr:ABC transporter substrate-binding protein [Arthrobacter sp. BL-252-APC-1A]MSR98476.1 ABC transporter substrate-binding protein [Arthrobacter sp. BL-252-APC-1A]
MKRSLSTLGTATLLTTGIFLTSCGSDAGTGDGGGEGPVKIGISQLMDIEALDDTREGFIKGMSENGYPEGEGVEYDYQNAQGDQATATQIAAGFASSDLDLVFAIATPAAQSVAQAVGNIPVVFSAVTEPVEAGIVESWDAPGANITGTSNLGPVEDQIALIKELAPEAKTIGVVYSSGEVNSRVQVDLAREAAEELGMELKEAAISATSEVQQAAQSLDVDALYVPTDSHVVAAIDSVVEAAETKQIPLVVGDSASVEAGGVATYGLDYEQLGYQTALMAIKILEGEDPAGMPVEKQTESLLVLNKSAAARMGVTLPQDMLDAADTVID